MNRGKTTIQYNTAQYNTISINLCNYTSNTTEDIKQVT